MPKANLSTFPSAASAAVFIDNLVTVSGLTRAGIPGSHAELVGTLVGVTYTEDKVIVYMDGSQNTSFSRDEDVNILTIL